MNDLIKKVTNVTNRLMEISREGYDLEQLTRIWAMLPVEDDEGMSYLESASQCILEVSSLVNESFPKEGATERTARKYRLMASLLNLKADQLDITV